MGVLTLDGRILRANNAFCEMSGYSLEELSKRLDWENVYPEDREIDRGLFQQLSTGGRDSYQVEKRYVRRNGEVFWTKLTLSAVRDPEGKPQYLIGMIEDIDTQKRDHEKLAAQDADYRRSLEKRVEERTHELTESNHRLQAEIEQRQKAEQALGEKAAEDAIIAERTRLARELHDSVTQTLFSASLIAEILPELLELNPSEALKTTDELRQLTRGALAEMRTLLLELRPAAVTQARFEDLLRQLSEALIGRSRLPVKLNVEGEGKLPPEVQVALYRIAQESLNNVVKHAQASQITIDTRYQTSGIKMEISDDGSGFRTEHMKPTSLGLRIMQERADAIGARLQVVSNPGKGTCVIAEWDAGSPSEGK
jgi:PAS domain S-box-containing protein